MQRISGRGALAAGFRLIGREPLAVAVWCGLYFVLTVVPQTLTWGPMLRMFQAMGEAGGAISPAVLQAEGELFRYQPLSYLGALAVMLLIPPAVFRAVLFPGERSYFFMRVGARELWMLLAVIVTVVMFFIGYFLALLPVMVLTGVIAAATGGSSPVAAVGLLLVIPALGFLVWALLRFSFAPVMSFADRNFRLPEAWTLSRGHAGKMFLVWFVLILLTFGVEIAWFGIGFAALGGSAADLARNPVAVFARVGAPALAGIGATFALLGVWFYIMWSAAWAQMYRDLRVVPADVFD